MKNVYLIKTDKPSRLSILNNGKLNFGAEFISSSNAKAQHIYITNDEEIKEGDWCLGNQGTILKVPLRWISSGDWRKIILTTDSQLIADGVQAIDNEFLEWFVKNPNCEEVENKVKFIQTPDNLKDGFYYKIIIPKEEVLLQSSIDGNPVWGEPKQENCCTPIGQIKRYLDCKGCDRKPKQETLEEFIERTIDESFEIQLASSKIEKYMNIAAQWQQQKSYSEEEVLDLLFTMSVSNPTNITEWFEQIKKN